MLEVPLMNPLLCADLIDERHARIKRDFHPPPRPIRYRERRKRSEKLRQRLGWGLVEVGLRLSVPKSR